MICFRYLFTNTFFPTGHWSSFEMAAISFLLTLFSLPQSYIMCSTVWLPLAQGHTGDSIILNRCRYVLVFPWAFTIVVYCYIAYFTIKLLEHVIVSYTYPYIYTYSNQCVAPSWIESPEHTNNMNCNIIYANLHFIIC